MATHANALPPPAKLCTVEAFPVIAGYILGHELRFLTYGGFFLCFGILAAAPQESGSAGSHNNVHWHFLRRYFASAVDEFNAWECLRTVRLGRQVYTLPPHFAALCSHGAKPM